MREESADPDIGGSGLDPILARLGRAPVTAGNPLLHALDELDITQEDAYQILHAQSEWPSEYDRWLRFRTLDGDLRVDVDVTSHVWVNGHVGGSLLVNGTRGGLFIDGVVDEQLAIDGDLDGLRCRATVGGGATVSANIAGEVWIGGRVRGGLVARGAPVGGTLEIVCDVDEVSVERGAGELVLSGQPAGEASVFTRISGDVTISGEFTGPVHTEHPFDGDLWVAATIGGHLSIGSRVAGNFHAYGDWRDGATLYKGCGGDMLLFPDTPSALSVEGSVGGTFAFEGSAEQLHLRRLDVTGRATLSPKSLLDLTSLEDARFESPVHLGDNLSIARCDFRRCVGIEHLDLVGADLFTDSRSDHDPRNQVAELIGPDEDDTSARERASINRQLRMNLEGRGNRPAAAVFYRGEMNGRRQDARQRNAWFEWGWISAYKWLAGYGTSVWRPTVALALTAALVTGLMGRIWIPTADGRDALTDAESTMFVLQSMATFFRPPEAELSATEQAVQLVARFIGPILVALAVFGAREKVAR